MNALRAEQEAPVPEEEADVPPPTDNGRVPVELVPLVKAASATLRPSLYFVVGSWVAYLLLLPRLVMGFGWPALALIPTLGAFLLSWLGYYRHELWHSYVAGVNNPRWFNLVSYLLFSDPAVYRIAHPAHHKYVHTLRDIEFFCEGYETNPAARRAQFRLELLFGNMAWELTCLHRLFRENRYTRWASRACLGKRAALFFALNFVSRWLTPGSGWYYLGCYMATLWIGSLVTRHNQWIEHLGILSEGSIAERNLLTRNVSSDTLFGKLFNFMNHDDAKEHVFHHTEPQLNTRGFPGLSLPPGARTITLPQYARLLIDHYRSL